MGCFNSQESFNNVRTWLGEIDKYATDNVNKLLVGNKCDIVVKNVLDVNTAKVLTLRHMTELQAHFVLATQGLIMFVRRNDGDLLRRVFCWWLF